MTQIELDDIKSFHGQYGTLLPGMAEQLFQAVVVTDVEIDSIYAAPSEPAKTAKPKRTAKTDE